MTESPLGESFKCKYGTSCVCVTCPGCEDREDACAECQPDDPVLSCTKHDRLTKEGGE